MKNPTKKKSIKIILSENGTKQRIEALKDIHVPDIWDIIEKSPKEESKRIGIVWHLAHDLLGALRSIEQGDDIRKPIHTKKPIKLEGRMIECPEEE